MRLLLAFLALLACLTIATPGCAGQPGDEPAVRAVFETFRDGWNTPGFPKLEGLLAPDADFVVVTGKWLQGRDAIVAYHRNLLRTFYAGSLLVVDKVTLRFVDQHHAVAHLASTVQYTHDGQTVRRPSLATVTLSNASGSWLIDTFQNTITGGPGYMFNFAPALPASK